jgi:hypothetical protein
MQLAKMVEELLLAFVGSVLVSLMVFYAVALTGSFVTFWLSYYVTLCNGIAVAYLVGGSGWLDGPCGAVLVPRCLARPPLQPGSPLRACRACTPTPAAAAPGRRSPRCRPTWTWQTPPCRSTW